MNSKGAELMGLAGMKEPWVEKDSAGKPTGRINDPGLAQMAAKIPRPAKETFETNALALIGDLNKAGITTAGISGCADEATRFFRARADKGEATFRFMCMVGIPPTPNLQSVEQAVAPALAKIKLYQGDNWIDDVMIGESLNLSDNMVQAHTNYTADQLAVWRGAAMEVAKNGLPLHQHATISETFPAFLDQIEAVNKVYPIRNLRWSFAHMDQVSANDLARMKKLGMYAGVRAIPSVMGGEFSRAHGEKSVDMPPLKMIQDSGILWGIHTDTTEVNQYKPFQTLYFLTTGKMVGGKVVNRQPVTREEALIAHTRNNAFLVFRENDLGSISAGKLADLVVMDRDYLTVPVDQIKDIKVVQTMVGGRIAYDAASPAARGTK